MASLEGAAPLDEPPVSGLVLTPDTHVGPREMRAQITSHSVPGAASLSPACHLLAEQPKTAGSSKGTVTHQRACTCRQAYGARTLPRT